MLFRSNQLEPRVLVRGAAVVGQRDPPVEIGLGVRVVEREHVVGLPAHPAREVGDLELLLGIGHRQEIVVHDPYVPQTITALAAFDTIPFKGVSSGAQGISFATDGAGAVDLALTEVFDSGNTFNGSIFTAPVDGYYHFDVKAGLACTAGAPVTNTTLLYLKKNGFQIPSEVSFYPTEDLVGRTLILSSNLELNAGDEIKAAVSVSVAGGTFPATWSVTQNDTWFSGFKIKSK